MSVPLALLARVLSGLAIHWAFATDPQILAVILAANKAEIFISNYVGVTSKSPEVAQFARDVVTDQTHLDQQVFQLLLKLNMRDEESGASQTLEQRGTLDLLGLKTLSGKASDQAYAATEVNADRAVLDRIDRVLLPFAANAEVRALLQRARPIFSAHLDRAEKLAQIIASRPRY